MSRNFVLAIGTVLLLATASAASAAQAPNRKQAGTYTVQDNINTNGNHQDRYRVSY
jgi:hypothetical protein